MTVRPWVLRQAVAHQVENVRRLLTGRRLATTSLGSMTLSRNDVALAVEWRSQPSRWHDVEMVARYEKEFASWNGSRHAFAFMAGRVALSACIHALGLKADDEVLLPGYTCVVVPNAFHYAGVKTVYCDIELETYGLDAGSAEKHITPRTRAILIQHLYGLVCRDYESLLDLAKQHGLAVIEDCAHATGAEFNGRKVGNRGDVAFYSSEQSKVFNTIQGGVAVANRDDLADRMREYYEKAPLPADELVDKLLVNVILNYYQQTHPQRWWLGDVVELLYGRNALVSTLPEEERGIRPRTYGCRMSAPIAALGSHQLGRIDHYNQRRRQTAEEWTTWCEAGGYRPPAVIPGSVPVYLRYPVIVEPERKRDRSWARDQLGVDLGVWYVSNIHPVSWPVAGCPNADLAVSRCVNFPCLR